MKLRIFITTFGVSLLWLALFSIKSFNPQFPFNKYVAIGLFSGSLLRFFFNNRKYIISLKTDNDNVKIEYYTFLLVKKEMTLPTSQVNRLEYHKKDWLLEEFDSLLLTTQNETVKFLLTTSKIKEQIKNETSTSRILNY